MHIKFLYHYLLNQPFWDTQSLVAIYNNIIVMLASFPISTIHWSVEQAPSNYKSKTSLALSCLHTWANYILFPSDDTAIRFCSYKIGSILCYNFTVKYTFLYVVRESMTSYTWTRCLWKWWGNPCLLYVPQFPQQMDIMCSTALLLIQIGVFK